MTHSLVKISIANTERWINCTVHGKRTSKETGKEYLHIKIGKQTMWVPASEVILGSPINSIDKK